MHQLVIYNTEHINSNLNYTIHANIPNTHTLTSTSHHQSVNDLLYPLGLIVTPCPQIAYNQAMQWAQSYTKSCISLSLMDNYINMHIITNNIHQFQCIRPRILSQLSNLHTRCYNQIFKKYVSTKCHSQEYGQILDSRRFQ